MKADHRDTAIYVRNLSKSFGEVAALQHIDLDVRSNEIFGLIGPDGAGKTSLFRIICTLLMPDGGSIRMHGHDVVSNYRKIRRMTGYMAGRFSLYQDLTVEENLSFYATVFGSSIRENYHLIRDIYSHIEPFKERRAGQLSGGMKQKLALSCALIHRPRVLVLDEPTTGVDAVSRKEFWEMLMRLRENDMTVLVSTPYMDEAVLCDRVGLIQKGQLLSVDTPEGIIGGFDRVLWSATSEDMYRLMQDIRLLPWLRSSYLFGRELHITFSGHRDRSEELKALLEESGHKKVEIKQIAPGIEDCFMALMKHNETGRS